MVHLIRGERRAVLPHVGRNFHTCDPILNGIGTFKSWHDYDVYAFKSDRMNEVILFMIVSFIGYICSMSMVLVLRKIFFPFFTKEELTKRGQIAL